MAPRRFQKVLDHEGVLSVYHFFISETVNGKLRHGIQQDNTRPHVSPSDQAIWEAGHKEGHNICVGNQPANSPDLNVLDLGYFTSIQALQQTKCAMDIDSLIEAVQASFEELSSTKLENTFVTLMTVMEQVLLKDGNNDYKIPHVKKQARIRSGKALSNVLCSSQAVVRGRNLIELSS